MGSSNLASKKRRNDDPTWLAYFLAYTYKGYKPTYSWPWGCFILLKGHCFTQLGLVFWAHLVDEFRDYSATHPLSLAWGWKKRWASRWSLSRGIAKSGKSGWQQGWLNYYLAGCFKYFLCSSLFIPTWGNDPIWLIFFRWVETTN